MLLECPVDFDLLTKEHFSIHTFNSLFSFLCGLILYKCISLNIASSPVEVEVEVADVTVLTEDLLDILLLGLLVDARYTYNVALD